MHFMKLRVCVWSDSRVQSSVIMSVGQSDSEHANIFIMGLCAKWKWAPLPGGWCVRHVGVEPRVLDSSVHSPTLTLNSRRTSLSCSGWSDLNRPPSFVLAPTRGARWTSVILCLKRKPINKCKAVLIQPKTVEVNNRLGNSA